ncbi:hypothetical protein [Paenisporosarcina sp. NPDC076898]|uniref:hypothetical protein n=1 Tax=unclassified Paenisporosarcina TaxID=2642018 RepID=UPI003D01460E
MSNSDRLEAIKAYFANEEKVKVEVPVKISKTSKGDVHHYFNGERAGYKFRHGIAWVERIDLHKFRDQHFIIHEEESGESK